MPSVEDLEKVIIKACEQLEFYKKEAIDWQNTAIGINETLMKEVMPRLAKFEEENMKLKEQLNKYNE